jgi:hypothetical protein
MARPIAWPSRIRITAHRYGLEGDQMRSPSADGLPSRPAVFFVCMDNVGRSQTAAGFVKRLAGDRWRCPSPGSEPAEEVNSSAIQAMTEKGIDLSHRSLLADIARILAIYSENSKVIPMEVVSTDELGLVLITEAAVAEGRRSRGRRYRRVRAERVERFEAYAQTLVMTPPRPS